MTDPKASITVRMSHAERERLKDAAHERRTSLQKFCIHKLLKDLPAEPAAVEDDPADLVEEQDW